jgi:hypothetical protein
MAPLLLNRRNALFIGPAFAFVQAMPRVAQAAVLPEITAYRTPGCGCCEKWAAELQAAGFRVAMNDDPDLDARRAKAGVPPQLAGCHTAFLGEYVIEGHVPAADIIRLLDEKPQALGLAVPGMPMGSPGMEMDGAKDAFDVMLFTRDGRPLVYASH